MGKTDAQLLYEAMTEITEEALKSKETTWQLLIDLGLYTQEDKRRNEERLRRQKNKKK